MKITIQKTPNVEASKADGTFVPTYNQAFFDALDLLDIKTD